MCEKNLTIDQFSQNKRKKDGLQSQCKSCHRLYRRKHYEKNRQKYIDKAKKWQQEFFRWWKEYKSQFVCEKCGEDHPACIQFHHPNNDKYMAVSQLLHLGNKSKILEEVAKCIPLCANCHFKVHWRD